MAKILRRTSVPERQFGSTIAFRLHGVFKKRGHDKTRGSRTWTVLFYLTKKLVIINSKDIFESDVPYILNKISVAQRA